MIFHQKCEQNFYIIENKLQIVVNSLTENFFRIAFCFPKYITKKKKSCSVKRIQNKEEYLRFKLKLRQTAEKEKLIGKQMQKLKNYENSS